jgi:hypothetical protein
VTFVKGTDFFADGSGASYSRLAFSFFDFQHIDGGVATLASLVGAPV